MDNKYDLIERTEKFGIMVINLANKTPKNIITLPLISQFIRSGTSVGANYCEADNAESKNDFKHKLGISKKEAKETIYWLKMIINVCPDLTEEINLISREANELNLIFNSIINRCS
jgi:four helix bundle protein